MVEASEKPELRDMDKDPEKSHQVLYYQFDQEIKEKCQKVLESDKSELSDFVKEKLEKEAMKNWDVFYSHHKDNFWKDRHYLKREFHEFVSGLNENKETGQKYPIKLLDTGCGVGNSFYPLFEYFDNFSVDCFDFSPKAIEALKTHKWFDQERVDAKVCDIVKDEKIPFADDSADFAMVIFLLSAISPENFPVALSKLN